MKPKQGEQLESEIEIVKLKSASLADEFNRLRDLIMKVQKDANIDRN